MSRSEVGVRVSEVESDKSAEFGRGLDNGLVEWRPMEFQQQTYNNFHVEYAFLDGNFVVHFYVHPNAPQVFPEALLESWWQGTFAHALSSVAQEYFRATLPRIVAKYTLETASWWFKAQGYGELLDPIAFLHGFFELLDETLPTVDGRPPACEAATAS
jgi:hypothetical protein